MTQERRVIPIAGAGASPASGCGSGSSCGSGGSGGGCGSGGCGSGSTDDPTSRLQAEGWVLRTTIGEPRLSEVVENYRGMGYEVHVEYFSVPAKETKDGDGEACTTCFDAPDTSDASRAWGAVYVRRQKAGGALDEELF